MLYFCPLELSLEVKTQVLVSTELASISKFELKTEQVQIIFTFFVCVWNRLEWIEQSLVTDEELGQLKQPLIHMEIGFLKPR